MKNILYLRVLLCLGMVTMFYSASNAQTSNGFAGTWYSATGNTTMTVNEKDGFVDINGRDDETSYECSGIIEKSSDGVFVECYGTGINKASNTRFFYVSKLKMVEKGKSMDESWEAKTPVRGEVVKSTGSSTFRRTRPETRPGGSKN